MWAGKKKCTFRPRKDQEHLVTGLGMWSINSALSRSCPPPTSRIRRWPVLSLVIIVGFLLGIRLVQLTIIEGSWRRAKADENRILTLPVMAPRGVLTDRGGTPLTRNIPIYRRQVPGTTPAQLQFETVSREQVLTLLANPSERISYDVSRDYPCGQACSALVGYVSEVTDPTTQQGYRLGELAGKVGAERAFERYLRGQPGEEYLEVNASGKAVRTVGMKEPQSGSNVRLSVDAGLTQILYDAFEGKPGAAVALSPNTGEVLALVSSPSFDPSNLGASLAMQDQPFFNRAVAGAYAPGSTFKIVTALAALEEGKISSTTQFEDTGELTIGEYRFGNWLYDEHGRTEGSVNVVRALARSNDIFFYKIGEAVGAEKLAEWAGLMGYGKSWEMTSWGESMGLVPSPKWKQEKRGEKWYLGNTYHMSIGQGDVLATPLQVTVMTAAVASRGVVCPPHIKADDKPVCQQLNLHEGTIDILSKGMVEACQRGGTGAPFFDFSPQVACKTGTAQQGGEKDLPHAWFTVYAPAENPTIALTVLVEKGGQGSQVAAPIAKKAIEYWLGK